MPTYLVIPVALWLAFETLGLLHKLVASRSTRPTGTMGFEGRLTVRAKEAVGWTLPSGCLSPFRNRRPMTLE